MVGNVRGALWAILGLLSWFSAFDARGDSTRRKIELTNCPTPLSISLPPIFDGSTDDRKNFKTDLVNMFGKAVLALHSSSKPGVFLIVTEPETAGKQGTFTLADIDAMKARASKAKILAQESGDTWLTVVSDLSFKGGELDYHGYFGVKFSVALICQ